MRVLVVFPDVPRAVFTTALGWYRAIERDSDVDEVLCSNTRGYYGLPEHAALSRVGSLQGIDVTVVIAGRQVYDRLAPGTLPGVSKALVLTDEPYETGATQLYNSSEWSGTYGVVGSNDSSTVGRHENGMYLPCAYDDTVRSAVAMEPRWDIGFVGGVDERRIAWLSAVDSACPGAAWCVVGPKWRPRSWSRLRSRYKRVRMNTNPSRGYLGPDDVAAYYSQCRIVLNIHRGGEGAYSPNPRTHDLLGYGVPAIQDFRRDTPASVIQVESAGQMGEFVRAYIAGRSDEVEQMRASVAGGLSVAGDHSYCARWAVLKTRLGC